MYYLRSFFLIFCILFFLSFPTLLFCMLSDVFVRFVYVSSFVRGITVYAEHVIFRVRPMILCSQG